MKLKIPGLLFLAVSAYAGGDKGPPVVKAANDLVEVTATLYNGKDAVKQEVGSDLGGYYILVKVALAPKPGKTFQISNDDFLLRSFNDGQRCQPFAPSQIAGRGALIVSSVNSGSVMAENPGPMWGGIPMGGPMGGAAMGNAAGPTSAEASLNTGSKEKENPLLRVLKDKALPEKKIDQPAAGLLYFSLEGKHKTKDLELDYNGAGGKLALHFR